MRNVKIKFPESFMWNELGIARFYLDQQLVLETKEECTIQVNDLENHSLVIQFTKLDNQFINVELPKGNHLEIICTIKYASFREYFKYIIYGGLLLFYIFIMKIFRQTITNNDYKIYYSLGLIILITFCLDSLFEFLVKRFPQKMIYFREASNNLVNNKRVLTYNKK